MSKWSVSIRAEGDRVIELEEVVALADAVAKLGGIASGVGAMAYGAQIVVEAENADEAVEQAVPAFEAAVAEAELPAVAGHPRRGRWRRRDTMSATMIRLGSLAGYPFEGPRVLGGWTPPEQAAVYAILYRADPVGKPHDFAVIDVDQAEDLSKIDFRSGTQGRTVGNAEPETSGDFTSAPTRCPAGLPLIASRSSRN